MEYKGIQLFVQEVTLFSVMCNMTLVVYGLIVFLCLRQR